MQTQHSQTSQTQASAEAALFGPREAELNLLHALKKNVEMGKQALDHILKKTGQEPGVLQLAETLQTTPEQIALAIRASLPAISLTPTDEEDGQREWDVPVDSPEESLSDRIGLAEVMEKLPPEDRQIIRLRFFGGRTQSETAKILGTTQVQISRRERKILKWMRAELLGEGKAAF